MKSVKVSVIIYVLNDISYIERCIRSVMNQTLQEIEILIIDGGSTDGTLEVIKKLAQQDLRIRMINSLPGVGHQFNVGLREAIGEYIGICESDDHVLPYMYEKEYELAKQYKLDVIRADKRSFCEIRGKDVFFQENIAGWEHVYDTVIDPKEDMSFIQLGSLGIWSGIYRREFLLEQKVFMNETQGAAYQDTSFAFMAAVKAERAMILKEAFYHYRVDNPNSSSNNPQGIRKMVDEYGLLKRRLKEEGVFKKYKEYYLAWKIYACLWFYDLLDEEYKNDYIAILYEDLHEEMLAEDYQENKVTIKRRREVLESAKRSFSEFSALMERNNGRLREMEKKFDQIRLNDEIIIFGSGNVGKLVFQYMYYSGNNVVAYIDNNERSWGEKLEDIVVLSPEKATDMYPNAIYIIANEKHYEEMDAQLKGLCISKKKIIICDQYDIFLRRVLVKRLQEGECVK